MGMPQKIGLALLNIIATLMVFLGIVYLFVIFGLLNDHENSKQLALVTLIVISVGLILNLLWYRLNAKPKR